MSERPFWKMWALATLDVVGAMAAALILALIDGKPPTMGQLAFMLAILALARSHKWTKP